MRKAAGILLIILGVSSLCFMIDVVVAFDITIFLAPFYAGIQGFIVGGFLLGFVASAAIPIAGGIFCLRRRYWEVCLGSALLAAFSSVLLPALLSYTSLSIIYTSMGWTIWVMFVAAVISVVFILRTKKEWQEISDSVDGKVSYDG